MFSYIQTKFIQPLSIAGLSSAEGVRVIQDRFKSGNRIVEIFGEKTEKITANAAAAWAEVQINPLVWLRLEKDDGDAGRFWTLLVMGLRQYQPAIGLTVLNTILDHHSLPVAPALEQLSRELSGLHLTVVLDGIEHIHTQDWWPGFVSWLQTLTSENCFLLLNFSETPVLGHYSITLPPPQNYEKVSLPGAVREWIDRLTPELKLTLAAMGSWWLPWLQIQFERQLASTDLTALQAAGFIRQVQPGVWIPSRELTQQLQSGHQVLPVDQPVENKRALTAWLEQQGEWLESIRYTLKAADFEEAAALFEQHAESLLEDPGDALDVLFWLKEMPGILLTSRPVLCWLAAACAAQFGLALQVKSFLDAAENNLMSFTRFSRSQEQWRNMVIIEDGVTVADLLERIEGLRSR